MYSMEKKMFKTQPFVSEKVWGYERWIVSTLEAGQSRVDDSVPKLGGMMLGNIVGNNYPLLVKVIQANDTLSVQVHPDDAYASIYEHTTGKTECWYVLDAVPDAHIIYASSCRMRLRKMHWKVFSVPFRSRRGILSLFPPEPCMRYRAGYAC